MSYNQLERLLYLKTLEHCSWIVPGAIKQNEMQSWILISLGNRKRSDQWIHFHSISLSNFYVEHKHKSIRLKNRETIHKQWRCNHYHGWSRILWSWITKSVLNRQREFRVLVGIEATDMTFSWTAIITKKGLLAKPVVYKQIQLNLQGSKTSRIKHLHA